MTGTPEDILKHHGTPVAFANMFLKGLSGNS